MHYLLYSLQYCATWLGPADAEHHAAASGQRPAATGKRSSTSLDAGASFTVQSISLADANQFALNRYGPSPSFLVFHPDLRRQQILARNWTLVADLSGQLASGPLIVNEQYAAGGVDSVRGYTEAERLGDRGARTSAELRTPQLFASRPRVADSYFYLFADAARVRVLDPQPGERTGYHLASEGIGYRFKFAGWSADVDGARADSAGLVTRAGGYSAQFRVAYSW